MFDCSRVAAKSIAQETRYPTDRRDTNAGHVVDAAIGEILLQIANDLPAIDQRLQLRWRAQVLEKFTTFLNVLETVHRAKKGIFVAFLLADSVVAVGFHDLVLIYVGTNVLTHYYTNTNFTRTILISFIG